MVLCIWRSPTGDIMAMITPSVSRDEAWSCFVARGGDAKVLGHGVQLEVKVLQAVHDLELFLVNVRYGR